MYVSFGKCTERNLVAYAAGFGTTSVNSKPSSVSQSLRYKCRLKQINKESASILILICKISMERSMPRFVCILGRAESAHDYLGLVFEMHVQRATETFCEHFRFLCGYTAIFGCRLIVKYNFHMLGTWLYEKQESSQGNYT